MKWMFQILCLIFIFNGCVRKYDICEYDTFTGELVAKQNYELNDSIRILTKNIRLNNYTCPEIKRMEKIAYNKFFYLGFGKDYDIIYSIPLASDQFIINDTSICFKMQSVGAYTLTYFIGMNYNYYNSDWYCRNQYGATTKSLVFNVTDNSPKPPSASFNCPSISTPSVIYFVNTSQNATSYEWNFGDPESGSANTSTLINPSHDFKTPKTYSVTLTAKNNFTTQTITKPITITPVPKTKCRITKIEIGNGDANGFNQQWDAGDYYPDTYVAIKYNGNIDVSFKSSAVNNVQSNMLPLTFNLPTPYEIINTNNNFFKSIEILIMDDDSPSLDQQMGSVLFNANLPLITYSTESLILYSNGNKFYIALYFDYIN